MTEIQQTAASPLSTPGQSRVDAIMIRESENRHAASFEAPLVQLALRRGAFTRRRNPRFDELTARIAAKKAREGEPRPSPGGPDASGHNDADPGAGEAVGDQG